MLNAVQLQERLTGIGGSDEGTINGLNPYKSPYELWLEKTGQVVAPDLSDNERVHFGNVLEDVVAAEFTRRTGKKVRRVNRTLRHPKYPFMIANLDRDIVGENAILECKTASAWINKDEWGPDGSDFVPASYNVQVQHYMFVTGARLAYLAVLIGGNEFRIYHIQRDDELIAMMLENAQNFWRAVETMTPPDCINAQDAKVRYPGSVDGKTIEADDAILEAMTAIKARKADIKAIEKEIDDILDALMPLIEDAEAIAAPDGKILATYKTQTRTSIDTVALKKNYPAIATELLRSKDSRTFLIK